MLTQDSADSTLTIAPPPFFARTGAKARATTSGPKKLVSSSARAATSPSSPRKPEPREDAGIVDTRVTSPSACAAAATSSGLVTSSGIGSTPAR